MRLLAVLIVFCVIGNAYALKDPTDFLDSPSAHFGNQTGPAIDSQLLDTSIIATAKTHQGNENKGIPISPEQLIFTGEPLLADRTLNDSETKDDSNSPEIAPDLRHLPRPESDGNKTSSSSGFLLSTTTTTNSVTTDERHKDSMQIILHAVSRTGIVKYKPYSTGTHDVVNNKKVFETIEQAVDKVPLRIPPLDQFAYAFWRTTAYNETPIDSRMYQNHSRAQDALNRAVNRARTVHWPLLFMAGYDFTRVSITGAIVNSRFEQVNKMACDKCYREVERTVNATSNLCKANGLLVLDPKLQTCVEQNSIPPKPTLSDQTTMLSLAITLRHTSSMTCKDVKSFNEEGTAEFQRFFRGIALEKASAMSEYLYCCNEQTECKDAMAAAVAEHYSQNDESELLPYKARWSYFVVRQQNGMSPYFRQCVGESATTNGPPVAGILSSEDSLQEPFHVGMYVAKGRQPFAKGRQPPQKQLTHCIKEVYYMFVEKSQANRTSGLVAMQAECRTTMEFLLPCIRGGKESFTDIIVAQVVCDRSEMRMKVLEKGEFSVVEQTVFATFEDGPHYCILASATIQATSAET